MLVQPVRVGETTTTTGTGTYTLAGAIDSGYETFLGRLGAGTSRVHYACYSTAGYEVGVGEFNGSNQLSRSQIIYSSNSNNAVNWSAGTKTIIALWPAGSLGISSLTGNMSASTFLTLADAFVVFSSASANATVAMPALAATPPGFSITFRNSDSTYSLTLDPDGSETIDGGTSWIIPPGRTVRIVRAPSTWLVLPTPRRFQLPFAWVAFDGGASPTIRKSFRVTSVTSGATGTYTINLSDTQPDANYGVIGTAQRDGSVGNLVVSPSSGGISTTATTIVTQDSDATTLVHCGRCTVVFFGETA